MINKNKVEINEILESLKSKDVTIIPSDFNLKVANFSLLTNIMQEKVDLIQETKGAVDLIKFFMLVIIFQIED